MQKVKILFLGVLVASSVLVTCQQESVPISPTYSPIAVEVATTGLLQIPTPAMVTSPTKTPSQLNVPPQIVTDTLTSTIATNTPFPLAATSTPALPQWVSTSEVNVLMLHNTDDIISIFNVESGARYDLYMEVGDGGPEWLWQETSYFLSPESPLSSALVFNIVTGEFVKLENVSKDNISPNGRYETQINSQEDGAKLVTVIDYETDKEIELVNPFHYLQSRNESFNEYATVAWSPNATFLSVMYEKHYYSDNTDLNLVVYMPSGEIYRQYAGINVSQANYWAPTLPYRILYREGRRICILKIIENEINCSEIVEEWLDSQNIVPFSYSWSPDGDKISYIYADPDITKTGFCYVELTVENVVCPISSDDLWLDRQLFVHAQFWSPDAQYVVLFLSNTGMIDVIGPMTVVIVAINDQKLSVLEGEYLWPFNNPWRPPIPSEINE